MKRLAPLLLLVPVLWHVSPPCTATPASARTPAPRVQDAKDPYDVPLTVRGRLVDVVGNPVPGVSPLVSGWLGNRELERLYGLPADWQDPTPAATDEDGRFAFTFTPPRAYQFTVTVDTQGYGCIAWRWSTQEVPGASELDLGQAVLERPGVIEGHLEDARGTLLTEGWTVSASHPGPTGHHRSGAIVHVDVDPSSGTYRIEDLPPGRIELSASNRSGARIEEVQVRTTSESVTHEVLVHRGPDNTRRLIVSTSSSPFHMFRPEPGHVHAIAADGQRIPLTPSPGRSNEWQALDVEPGLYRIEILEPRFRPWSQGDVSPGVPIRARLEGAAALHLTLTDPEGRSVARAGVHVRYENANFSPDTVTLLADGEELPLDGRFGGIVPGTWILLVNPEGYPPQQVRLQDLVAGETREVPVRIGAAASLLGRVFDASGSPVPGVRVQRSTGEVHGHDGVPGAVTSFHSNIDGQSISLRVRHRDEEVLTDGEGRFHFTGLADGAHAVRALSGLWARDDKVVQVRAGESAELDLHLPPTGQVRVQVQLPEGVDPEGMYVEVTPQDLDAPGRAMGASRRTHPPQEDVRAARTHDALPAGRVQVRVLRVFEVGHGSSTRQLHVQEAAVEAGGTTEVLCDLRESFPVDGRVRVLADGVPTLTAQMILMPVQDTSQREGAHLSLQAGERPDDDGWQALHAVPPGRYRMQVADSAQGWTWTAPEPVLVVSGRPLEREVAVPLLPCSVRIVDRDGRPRASQPVTWKSREQGYTAAEGTTDSEGRLVLHLPAGTYLLTQRPERADPRAPRTRVDWSAAGAFDVSTGSSEVELLLESD